MATQYSNKPIVTDGLVYALDFGNPKSYISGSSTASSLKFGSVTGSILTFGGASIPNLQNGLLKMVAPTSTTGSTIDTLQQFSDLIPTGDFTIQVIISGSSNAFITQGPSGTRVISTLSSTTGMFGWYINPVPYGGDTLYKTKTAAINPGLQHLTYRYSSGSYDLFVNGIPSPITSRGQTTSTNTGNLTINGRGSAASLSTQDLGNFYIYNRALTSDEIYSNYLIQAQRYGLPTIPKPYTIDENAFLFLSQSGITDPIITSSIDTFVKGLKSASLWDKMIAIYPFVGTGSVGVNLTGSQSWNLKEPTSAFYRLSYTGSWNGSTSGSTPSGSNTSINTGVLPFEYYPFKSDSNQHFSILSYDTPVSRSYLMGTGMTEDLAVSTLAGDYGTPAAAYSVRKVRTAYSGALMDVRRSYDNVTSSIGFVSNGDLDTGSLLDWVIAGRNTLPGAYSGLAAAYSLRRVSASYAGPAIEVQSGSVSQSIGFDSFGNLDTGSLLAFAGSGNAFVKTWYDQSGNGYHASQAVTSSQPQIVSGGSVITRNGKPILQTDGSSYMLATSFPYYGNVGSIFFTLYLTSTRSAVAMMSGGSEQHFPSRTSTGDDRYYNSTVNLTVPPLPTGLNLISIFQNTSTQIGNAFENSIQIATNYTTNSGQLGGGLTLFGRFGGSSLLLNEYGIPEVIIYQSDQSANRPLIENNINNYYNIYTGSNHGFVARWYDQSGNNRHANQTTQANQPAIVLSGSVLTINTKPSVYFDGINDGYNITQLAGKTRLDAYFVMTTVDTKFLFPDNNGSNYYGFVADSGSGTDTNNYFSSAILYTNNSNPLTIANTRNQVWQSLATGTQKIALHQSATSTGWTNYYLGTAPMATDYNYSGSFQEIIIYDADKSAFRDPIHYGINSYYNIYTQPSASFATSSFTISAASGSVSASLNNRLTSGIASSGPLGLITVSRTGSNSLTIARNGVTSSFAVPASGALSTGIYLGAINNNGIALGNSPLNISFASVGTGLTNRETQLLFNNVTTLRYNLGTTVDPEYRSVLNYARTQGFTLPSVQQQSFQNKLIIDLKQAGIWQKLDAFYLYATNGDLNYASINWKNPGVFPTVPGAGTILTPNVGITPTTTFSVPYVTNLPGSNFITSSGCFYYYDYFSAVSLTVLSSGGTNLRNRNSFGFNEFRMNDVVSTSGGYSLSGFRALKSIQFNSPNQLKITNQKTQYTITASGTSLTLYGVDNFMTFYGPSQHSLFAYGASLLNENSDFVDAIDNYFTAISL